MASTSSSSWSPYRVVINYFPGDMSYALATRIRIMIYHILTNTHHWLETFVPEHGDSIATETENVIRKAKLHIAIFSPSYAQSPCCLEELVLMLRSRTKIITIFYNVQPSSVRYSIGDYAPSFIRYEKEGRYVQEKIKEWKSALCKASNISGYEFKNTDFLKALSNVRPDKIIGSTSFSSLSPYHVFINYFPGDDISYPLAIKIYHTLTKAHKGLRVFLSNAAPKLRDCVATETEDAILRAKLHIAIFSPSYAQSPCCLEELVLMLRSRTKILPVFYNVEPSSLRWVYEGKGVYVPSFSEYERRYEPQRLKLWKTALYYASLFHGYEHKNTTDEGMLLKAIVNDTLTVMKNLPFKVPGDRVGFDELLELLQDFESTLERSDIGQCLNIRGIVGSGGCGITTSATEFSDKKLSIFYHCSFIKGGRHSIADLHTLKREFLQALVSVRFDNKMGGKRISRNRISSPFVQPPLASSFSSMSYDVYINRRVIDVKHTLAADISFELHVAIFSPKYAESSPWCLDEQSFMLKAGNKIFPVFYDVRPSVKAYNRGKAFDGVLCISSPSVKLSSRPFNSMAPICSSSTASSQAYIIGKAFDGVLPRSPLVSSSSSTSLFRILYDVFINHRGIDVKDTLAADIYRKLDSNGLQTFLDREELERGSSIPIEIEEAMLSAKLHIAIISPGYAQSPWCLQELAFMCFMLKTGTTILPVFYDVEPADIECIGQDKGIYREDFRRYKEKDRYPPEMLQKWKTALCKVCSFPGYKLKNPAYKLKNNEENHRLLQSILSCVRFRLGPECC